MKRWPSLLAILFAGTALANEARFDAPTEPPEATPDIIGEARDPESGELKYYEHYYCSDDALKCSVFYLRPDNQLIASKRLDYEPSKQAPVLAFRDFRLDREITIDRPDSDAVVDAGFDNFVRLQWQDLAGGEEVRFPFRMMGREEPIDMRASRRKGCDAGKLCLNIRLDSWLLGSFIDPIQLTYDRGTQRLLRFEGISNLKTEQGKSQKVEIEYRYQVPASASR
jgi:hypothetical protein